jgi:tripartite-type tricarboxylate transporter receptor subunit TctC
LVVHSGTGIKTFAEYIAYAKKNPKKLDYASTGPGSASHLAGELLDDMAGIDTVHVPYKGGAPALQDLLGGRVAAYFSTYSTSQAYIETGKLIPLASTGAQRLKQLPKIPTVAESGYPGFSATNWYAFVASSKVPGPLEHIVEGSTEQDTAKQLVKFFQSPEVADVIRSTGLDPVAAK